MEIKITIHFNFIIEKVLLFVLCMDMIFATSGRPERERRAKIMSVHKHHSDLNLYCTASAMCSAFIISLSAKSAIVRATFIIL